ncbi:transcriptional regulator FeaR, partial [Serratia marcescens]
MTALATLRDVGFEEWLGKINTACGRFCAKTLGPGFRGAMQEFRAHALRLSVVDVSQARLYRTPREIARSDGAHFFTVIQLRGSALMEQGDRQTLLSPGDMTLIDASRPSSFTFQRDSRQISLLLPRGCLPLPPPGAQRLGAELSAVRL